MQMDIYVSGSTSVARTEGRVRLLANMFKDILCLRVDWKKLTEWDAALWVRSRVNGGTKTAGAMARTALSLAEKFTAESFFAQTDLVKAQAFPKIEARSSGEPAKPATPLTWKHIEALEWAIDGAATEQQRVLAGFFVFLIHSSHRCSNGQRTRLMRLIADALMGESLLKGKKSWTKWAASRSGLTRPEWARFWMEELGRCGMPGHDFVVKAPNVAMDAWISRPAAYSEFSRSLHLLLMVYGGETPQNVVEFTPHSCRHVQVTAATQLAAQGLYW